MNITSIRVYPVRENRLRAYVTITLDRCFVIRDLKIIEGEKGFFIAMPSRRLEDGSYRDIAHPLNTETREDMERLIIEAYHRHVDGTVRSGEQTITADEESPIRARAAESRAARGKA